MFDETSKDNVNEVVSLLKEIRDLLRSQPTSASGGSSQGTATERTQKEDGTWIWVIPESQKPSKNPCKYCQAEIYWAKSKKGKNVPCNKDGAFHGDTCTREKSTEEFPKSPITSQEVPF
jgi:hypothetical protein